MQTFHQLVEYQAALYTKIGQIHVQSNDVDSRHIPKDLRFITKIKANWNVYKTRLNSVIEKILTLLQAFAQNQQVINLLNQFNANVYHLKRKGTTNFFLDCQTLVSFLFQHLLPRLQESVSP